MCGLFGACTICGNASCRPFPKSFFGLHSRAVKTMDNVASCSSTVLQKRKRNISSSGALRIRISSPSTSTFLADSSAEYAPSEDDAHDFYSPLFEAGSDADGKAALHGLITSRSRPMLVNGKLVVNQEKKYQCTWKDCGKAYSKPSRLEEHERSHTGEVRHCLLHCSTTIDSSLHLSVRSRAANVTSRTSARHTSTHICGPINQNRKSLTHAYSRDAPRNFGPAIT
jgi:hypothetical protein